jgi:3-hydroxybutyryl-CoA dehydrogenase
MKKIGVLGGGAMGAGIAQVAAQAGHPVVIVDLQEAALIKGVTGIEASLTKAVEKGKISAEEKQNTLSRILTSTQMESFQDCELVIEAIVEKLEIKQSVFKQLDAMLSPHCIIASNTSSLSITSIASVCQLPERIYGLHFFNPAPLMPLVEIVPATQSNLSFADDLKQLMLSWKKVPVIAKDWPGFIVNRVARPYYSEALRIYDEGLATQPEIDLAMKNLGFKMGPFELMDLIGHDVNYAVTESVFTAFYFDPRFKPSLTQKKLVEAGWFGRKSARGFYNYPEGCPTVQLETDKQSMIQNRILAMLINEACDSHYCGLASEEDLDLAMTKGVNYPKGLIAWGREIGFEQVGLWMQDLMSEYQDDRYRMSVGLKKRMV